MNQQDKLQSRLRDYYDQQAYSPSANDWEQAAAFVEKARSGKKRRKVALIIFLSGILGLLPVSLLLRDTLLNRNANNKVVQSQTRALNAVQKSVTVVPAIVKRSVQKPKVALPDVAVIIKSKHEVPISSPEEKIVPPINTDFKNETTGNENSSQSFIEQFPESKENTSTDWENTEQHADGNSSLNSEKSNVRELAIPALPAALANNLNNAVVEENVTQHKNENAKTDTNSKSGDQIPAVRDAAKTDSVSVVSQIVLQADSSKPAITRDAIYFEVGTAWTYGWKNDAGIDARGFVPQIGLGYSTSLNERSALSFGIYYTQAANLSASSKTSKESVFRYGEQSKFTKVTPATLHYLAIPFRYLYQLDQKNTVGGGLNFAYLLNVTAEVETYEEKPGFTSERQVSKLDGYTQGFSWYDCQAAIYYRRRILPALSIHAELFYGFVDIKQDQFFNLPYKERNSGIKFSICYEMFRK